MELGNLLCPGEGKLVPGNRRDALLSEGDEVEFEGTSGNELSGTEGNPEQSSPPSGTDGNEDDNPLDEPPGTEGKEISSLLPGTAGKLSPPSSPSSSWFNGTVGKMIFYKENYVC